MANKLLILLIILISTPLFAVPITTESERTQAISDVQAMALPFDIQLTPILPAPDPGSSALNFVEGMQDYARQLTIPTGFGEGEFTLLITVRLDETYPTGDISTDRIGLWSNEDPTPAGATGWWYDGNFLLDGHNDNDYSGTFDILIYNEGRVRWLFSDAPNTLYAVQNSNANSLLDGQYHQIGLVRRWSGSSDSDLELWVDGQLISTTTIPTRTDMRYYFDTWPGFPHAGWLWGGEKIASLQTFTWQDYKGLLSNVAFFGRALVGTEIGIPVTGAEPGIVGHFPLNTEPDGCDTLSSICLELNNVGWQ